MYLIKLIAGADVSGTKWGNKATAAVVVYKYPELKLVEKRTVTKELTFPYIPGLLAFREAPVLLEAFKQVENAPDIIVFDAQGIAHPREMGLATHMGILLDKPSIGCAKSRLIGTYHSPGEKVGDYSCLEKDGKVLGAVLRTKEGVNPIFVSIGFKVDLETSVKVVLNCCRGYKLPEPSRQAHVLAGGGERRK